MVRIFGIPNCDTMKKARQWLTDQGIDYEFHDYKRTGADEQRLRRWVAQVGWEALLNRRGTTWHKLDEALKRDLDEAGAIRLMQANPSLIKRPVLEYGQRLQVGFKVEEYTALFG